MGYLIAALCVRHSITNVLLGHIQPVNKAVYADSYFIMHSPELRLQQSLLLPLRKWITLRSTGPPTTQTTRFTTNPAEVATAPLPQNFHHERTDSRGLNYFWSAVQIWQNDMKDGVSISFVYLEIKPVHRYAKQVCGMEGRRAEDLHSKVVWTLFTSQQKSILGER